MDKPKTKEMKKTIILPALLMSGALLAGCSQQEETAPQSGTVELNLRAETGFKTRAIDEAAYTDINNYTVKLVNKRTGATVNEAKYSDWDLAYQVDSNTEYIISASYGQEVAASYDQLLCYGEETFSVLPGTKKTISFTAKPRAAKVSVSYSSDFTSYYKDCEVGVKTQHMTSPEVINIEKKDQDLYLKAGENENVELTFKVIDKQGNVVEAKGGVKTATVNPQTWLHVTVKPNVQQIEGGKFGITVIVNDEVTEEVFDFNVPNDVFN